MKISIIVPAYNEEKNIGQCLKSLVDQDFDENEYEIILVNNNSTDRTKEIALSFSKVRLIDEPKQGYVHALIRGCKQARGKIFVFTDADTIVPINWLGNYYQAYRDKKVVVAGGPGRFRPKIWQTTLFTEPFLDIVGIIAGLVCGFNFSIRKQTYFQVSGFNPKMNFNADTDLQIRAKKTGRWIFLKDNFVLTSSRHYQGVTGLIYVVKGLMNSLLLLICKKTLFYEFGDVRQE